MRSVLESFFSFGALTLRKRPTASTKSDTIYSKVCILHHCRHIGDSLDVSIFQNAMKSWKNRAKHPSIGILCQIEVWFSYLATKGRFFNTSWNKAYVLKLSFRRKCIHFSIIFYYDLMQFNLLKKNDHQYFFRKWRRFPLFCKFNRSKVKRLVI